MNDLIDNFLICDKNQLSQVIKLWESQKYQAKTNDEYDLICQRIKMGEYLLEFNKYI